MVDNLQWSVKTLELVMLINTVWGGAHRQGNKVTNHTEVRSMLQMCWAFGFHPHDFSEVLLYLKEMNKTHCQ